MSRGLEACKALLEEMCTPRHRSYAQPFLRPFNAEAYGFRDYHLVIRNPMDLETIKKKLDDGLYKNKEGFASDMQLIFHNCHTFIKDPWHRVASDARMLEVLFELRYNQIPEDGLDDSDGEGCYIDR